MRKYILEKSNIQVVNFYKRVFETADVDSSIVLFSNSENNQQISLFEEIDIAKVEYLKKPKILKNILKLFFADMASLLKEWIF